MDKERDDWSNGPAPVFTPMSYPRLHEFKLAQKAYSLVERVICRSCSKSSLSEEVVVVTMLSSSPLLALRRGDRRELLLMHGINLLFSYMISRMYVNGFYEKCKPVLPPTSLRNNFNIT